MRIDHINIKAPAELIEQVRDFYCSVLGLADGFRPVFRQGGYWLYAGDKALVHLSIGDRRADPKSRGYLDHIAFQSTGLEAVIARLQSLEIDFRIDYIPELDMTQVFFEDPAGTGIEVNFPGEK